MKTKTTTFNKDGSKRKSGSGRKKGSNSFVKVSFSQLKEYIGEKTPISVSRVWLESLGFMIDSNSSVKISTSEEKPEPEQTSKIQYTLNSFEEE